MDPSYIVWNSHVTRCESCGWILKKAVMVINELRIYFALDSVETQSIYLADIVLSLNQTIKTKFITFISLL